MNQHSTAPDIYIQPQSLKRHLQRRRGEGGFGPADTYKEQFAATITNPKYAYNHSENRVNAVLKVNPPKVPADRDYFLVLGFSMPTENDPKSFLRTVILKSQQQVSNTLDKAGQFWPDGDKVQFGGQHRRIRSR